MTLIIKHWKAFIADRRKEAFERKMWRAYNLMCCAKRHNASAEVYLACNAIYKAIESI